MRKRESMRNGGGGGRKRSKNIDEHRGQRKRIVERRKNMDGRKFDKRAGRKRRVHCTRRIDGEEARALNTRRHGRSHRIYVAEEIGNWGREKRNTLYGMLNNQGGKGLTTLYGVTFETT